MDLHLLGYISIGVVLGLGVAAVIWYRLKSRPITVTLSAAQIQSVIDGQLPLTTETGVTISKATVDLSGSQAAADFVIAYSSGGTTYTVVGQAGGAMRYDNRSGSFYIRPTDLRIDDISRNDLSIGQAVGSLIDMFSSAESAAGRKQWLSDAANAAVRAVVRVAATDLISRMPVYTLPNDKKGKAARFFLNDVQVRDGKLHLLLGGAK